MNLIKRRALVIVLAPIALIVLVAEEVLLFGPRSKTLKRRIREQYRVYKATLAHNWS